MRTARYAGSLRQCRGDRICGAQSHRTARERQQRGQAMQGEFTGRASTHSGTRMCCALDLRPGSVERRADQAERNTSASEPARSALARRWISPAPAAARASASIDW